jgi:hypothetical protein
MSTRDFVLIHKKVDSIMLCVRGQSASSFDAADRPQEIANFVSRCPEGISRRFPARHPGRCNALV